MVLYAFSVKNDVLSRIRLTLKNALNVQVMRNQFMSSGMKLKLGLYLVNCVHSVSTRSRSFARYKVQVVNGTGPVRAAERKLVLK